jgi:phage terminase large subunit-like protein
MTQTLNQTTKRSTSLNQTTKSNSSFYLGADLGQIHDYTALAVLEQLKKQPRLTSESTNGICATFKGYPSARATKTSPSASRVSSDNSRAKEEE